MPKLKSFFNHLGTPVGQAAATWIQTLCVVVGVIVANLQLLAMAEQNDGVRNKEFFELYKEYRSKHEKAVDEAVFAAYRAQNPATPEAELQRDFETTAPAKVLGEYLAFLRRLQDCGYHAVCSSRKTSDFVCQKAKQVARSLSSRHAEFRYPPWMSQDVQFTRMSFYNLLAEECSYLNATWFRVWNM